MTHRFESRARRSWHASAFLVALVAAACMSNEPTSPAIAHADGVRVSAAAATLAPADTANPSLSSRFGYVWANQPTTPSYTPNETRAYNAHGTGGTIQINRGATGQYDVIFTSPVAGWEAVSLGFAITAYGSSTLGCAVRSFYVNQPSLHVWVSCFNRVTNVHADSRFTLLVVGGASLNPRGGFVYASGGSHPSYTPDPLHSYSSSGAPSLMRVTYNADVGDYDVDLATGPTAGTIVFVSERDQLSFAPSGLCKLAEWLTTEVRVRCFDADNEPTDRQFWLLQIERGRTGRRLGFAYAHLPTTASYAPSPPHSRNSSGGAITVTRSGAGEYVVDFAGLRRLAGHTDNVQVAPVGTGLARCNVVSWSNSPTGLEVSVACRNINGAPVDARFNVLVIE